MWSVTSLHWSTNPTPGLPSQSEKSPRPHKGLPGTPLSLIFSSSLPALCQECFLQTLSICVCAKSLQSYPTLQPPLDRNLLGSSVHEILQAKLLEWVAMPSFQGSSQPRDLTHISYISCSGRQVLYH